MLLKKELNFHFACSIAFIIIIATMAISGETLQEGVQLQEEHTTRKKALLHRFLLTTGTRYQCWDTRSSLAREIAGKYRTCKYM